MHGGTVDVSSPGLGHGSEFALRLPVVVETPAPVPREPSGTATVPAKALRILVVDDNRDSAVSLAMLLKLTGHQTHTAFDGQQAVDEAAALTPDVVLLDIGLPKLNGYEACRRIRETPGGRNMTLVALTGWGQEEDREKSSDAGFNAHLVKPVDLVALKRLLASVTQNQERRFIER
jgi:CheY-like chemotaxis protein